VPCLPSLPLATPTSQITRNNTFRLRVSVLTLVSGHSLKSTLKGWVNFVSATARAVRSAQCAVRSAQCAVRSAQCAVGAHIADLPFRRGCWRAPTRPNSLTPLDANMPNSTDSILRRWQPGCQARFEVTTLAATPAEECQADFGGSVPMSQGGSVLMSAKAVPSDVREGLRVGGPAPDLG
jgi:hypothetical protein